MASFQSKVLKIFLRLPKRMWTRFNISKGEVNGHCCYVIKPIDVVENKHILYLHGGGYVYTIMSLHWDFLSKLIDAVHCTITVPIYQQIISEVKPEDVIVMGDSAGGGMSLALAQLVKEKNWPQPGNIILISPVLDLSFSNPEIQAMQKHDPISAVPALLDIGKWYGGDRGVKHYLVSPIYGSFDGLGPISIFTGTHDITNPDSRKFKSMADEKGIALHYYEYPSMLHIWPLFSFPESKKTTEEIIQIING
ncbi:MAG: alpha/beta hydrolase [Gorillibacterium sp.]|nr:alpha/beta hydrolase [Gorillibacterium sp.]